MVLREKTEKEAKCDDCEGEKGDDGENVMNQGDGMRRKRMRMKCRMPRITCTKNQSCPQSLQHRHRTPQRPPSRPHNVGRRWAPS